MIKNKDQRTLENHNGIIGYNYDRNNGDDCWGFNEKEDYLLIHFKFGDCKKCWDFSEKFEKLEARFIKEYDEYFNSENDNNKWEIISKIIELKKKYQEKVRLVLNYYDIEVDIDNLWKWLRINKETLPEQLATNWVLNKLFNREKN